MIVLIVEDNLNLAKFTSRSIAKARPEWKVLVAGSCFEATNLADHLTPDVALVDLSLPDGSGLDLMTELKHKSGDLSVIMTSASVTQRLCDEVERRGGHCVLEKPYDFRDFIKKAEEAHGNAGEASSEAAAIAGEGRDDAPPDPLAGEEADGVDYHYILNRLSGLLAGLKAFEADVRSAAGSEDEVRAMADEYAERLCGIVHDVAKTIVDARDRDRLRDRSGA